MTENTPTQRGGPVKRAPEGFYTAQEATKKLGMKTSTFRYYVRQGKIKRYVPPLRVEGYYDKKEIDRLANETILSHLLASSETETGHSQPPDKSSPH